MLKPIDFSAFQEFYKTRQINFYISIHSKKNGSNVLNHSKIKAYKYLT